MRDKNKDKEDNSNFLLKFSNRIETMGKEGIRGIMKHTNIQINEKQHTPNGYTATNPNGLFQRPAISRNQKDHKQPNKRYSYITNQCYPYSNNRDDNWSSAVDNTNTNHGQYSGFNIGDSIQRAPRMSLIHKPIVLNSLDYSEWKRYPNVIPFDDNSNNKAETQPYVNKHQIQQERFYEPYSLRDYKELKIETKVGGLGPNIGTKDWKKRAGRMNKMGLYGSAIMKERTGLNELTKESPNAAREREKQVTKEKSVRYKTNTYGEHIKFNQYLYTSSHNPNDMLEEQPKKEIKEEDFHEVLNLNKKKYFERLAKLKESLVSSNY